MPEPATAQAMPTSLTDEQILAIAEEVRAILLRAPLKIDDCLTVLAFVTADVCLSSSNPCQSLTAAAHAAHATIHERNAAALVRGCAEGVGHA